MAENFNSGVDATQEFISTQTFKQYKGKVIIGTAKYQNNCKQVNLRIPIGANTVTLYGIPIENTTTANNAYIPEIGDEFTVTFGPEIHDSILDNPSEFKLKPFLTQGFIRAQAIMQDKQIPTEVAYTGPMSLQEAFKAIGRSFKDAGKDFAISLAESAKSIARGEFLTEQLPPVKKAPATLKEALKQIKGVGQKSKYMMLPDNAEIIEKPQPDGTIKREMSWAHAEFSKDNATISVGGKGLLISPDGKVAIDTLTVNDTREAHSLAGIPAKKNPIGDITPKLGFVVTPMIDKLPDFNIINMVFKVISLIGAVGKIVKVVKDAKNMGESAKTLFSADSPNIERMLFERIKRDMRS